MKYLVVIGDGMADDAVPALSGKTPLEAADIPVMDALAQKGELGCARTVPNGVAPGSDTAFLSIFGYDPRVYFAGRSPFEAAGSGIALADGDVSYRCNMVTLSDDDAPYEEKKIVLHSGGPIHGHEALHLMDAVLADAEFAALCAENQVTFHVSPTYRHIVVQRGADITGLCCAPPHDHLGEALGPLLPQGAAPAAGLRAMMARAHAVLDQHPVNAQRRAAGKLPANGLWFWAEGRAIALPPFMGGRYKGAVISAVPLVRGIGVVAGLAPVLVEGATGELDTNFEGKADAAVRALADGADVAFVHVEAPDECTHCGDVPGKVQAIEWLSARCLARISDALARTGTEYRLLVLSDHKTLTATRGHDAGPVPYALYDSRGRQAGSGRPFTEADAAQGPFVAEGHTLIGRLFEA